MYAKARILANAPLIVARRNIVGRTRAPVNLGMPNALATQKQCVASPPGSEGEVRLELLGTVLACANRQART